MKTEELLIQLQERNKRVEADKAWETSVFRRVCIAVITYLIASAVMWSIGTAAWYLNALIPVVGYLLSTLSLPGIKQWWIKNKYTK